MCIFINYILTIVRIFLAFVLFKTVAVIHSFMSENLPNGVTATVNGDAVEASSEVVANIKQCMLKSSDSSLSSHKPNNVAGSQPNVSNDTDSIGSAGDILRGKNMSTFGSKASSLYGHNIDLDDEILVGDERELHNSCRSGNFESVERLVRSEIDVNCRNKHDRTPLHWAAGNGHLEIVKLLLDEGAVIDACDKFGMDALLWSAWFGHKHCIQHMIHAGVSKSSRNKRGSAWLHCAVQNDRLGVVDMLSQEMQDFDIDAVDNSGRSALHIACKYGRKDIVASLLKSSCNVGLKDKSGNTPLHTAAIHGHFGLINLLVSAKCNLEDTNDLQQTSLHAAAHSGHAEFCRKLLEHDIDVNCETDDELCPLHLAVSGNHVQVCKVLLEHNADIDSSNKHNQTPLHFAVAGSNIELTNLLLKAGANASVFDARSETPLHLAAENGLYDITEILLCANSNHNAKDLKGKTPLDVAARGNYVTIVDMIIKAERLQQMFKFSENDFMKKPLNQISFKPDKNPNTQHFRTLLYRLASKYLKPVDWKQLAFYWGFTDRQMHAIEEQYTGSKSHREHGHRMLLIWFHGCLLRNENPVKGLYEGLIGIKKTRLAEIMRTKATQTDDSKPCIIS